MLELCSKFQWQLGKRLKNQRKERQQQLRPQRLEKVEMLEISVAESWKENKVSALDISRKLGE